MKKSFFKKLSFVLALAMVMSVIAPAAGALAATAPKLNSTKKYLHLDVEDLNDYNFNIENKESGWDYLWESSDEDVAVVDEGNGVTTATGVGTAKITVFITDKDGEEVADLSATVVVRDNIAKLTEIYLQDGAGVDLQKLAVGTDYDFGRKYETVSGSTTMTSGITRWTLGAATAEEATINDSGVFVAKKAGEYTITANSFQSKEKYTEWLADNTKNVTATKNITVKVLAGIVAVKQVNRNKFNVTFDSVMSSTDLTKDTVKVYRIVNGQKVSAGTEKVKSVTLDATGKIATVEMYAEFAGTAVYNFEYGNLVSEFTAAKIDLSEVASIIFDDFNVNVNGSPFAMNEKVTALNKDGVVIYNGKDHAEFKGTLTFTYEGDITKGYLDSSNKTIYIYSKGYSAPVTAKFNYYVYNQTTKVYENLSFTDGAVATGSETDTNISASTMQFAIKATGVEVKSEDWKAAGFTMAAKDTTLVIHSRYKTNNASGSSDPYIVEDGDDFKFNYVSSNSDIVVINGDFIYPAAEGMVTVLVHDTTANNAVVGTFDVTVYPSRGFASAEIDTPYVTVGNHGTYGELSAKKATITVKDTMGSPIGVTVTGTNLTSSPSLTGAEFAPTVVALPQPAGSDFGKVFVNVTSQGAKAGSYYYKISLNAANTTRDNYLTVTVIEGNSGNDLTVAYWKLDLSTTSVDLKNVNNAKTVTYNVNGYNGKGIVVDRLEAADTAFFDIVIKKGGHTDLMGGAVEDNYTETTANVVWTTSSVVTGTALGMLATDTYVVTAIAKGDPTTNPTKRGNDAVISTASFAVVDTTAKTFLVENPVVYASEVSTPLAIARKALKLTLNGDTVSDANETANLYEITYIVSGTTSSVNLNTDSATSIAVGTNFYIVNVKYQVFNTDQNTYTQYKYDVNATISVR